MSLIPHPYCGSHMSALWSSKQVYTTSIHIVLEMKEENTKAIILGQKQSWT